MNKTLKLMALSASIIALGSCSALKRNNAAAFDSGDSMPLYPVTTSSKADLSIGGHWHIRTVGTIAVSGYEDEEWPFMEFVPAEARFYGNNGCNILNGSYRLGADNALTLSNVAATLRLCEGDTLAYPIADALDRTAAYSVANGSDGSTILSLLDAKSQPLMTLRKSDIDFLSGPWQVVAVDGKTVNMPDARLVFDLNTNRITGCAGCNRLNGEITRNPQVSSSIQFSNLATTRMTCPDIQLESNLLIALEEVVAVRKGKADTAEMVDSAGKTIVKLKKLSRQDL